MWIWWTKINRNPSILGRLSVIKWRNWTWWESYLNTGISDETQIAVVVWLQCIQHAHSWHLSNYLKCICECASIFLTWYSYRNPQSKKPLQNLSIFQQRLGCSICLPPPPPPPPPPPKPTTKKQTHSTHQKMPILYLDLSKTVQFRCDPPPPPPTPNKKSAMHVHIKMIQRVDWPQRVQYLSCNNF